ncbi:MAG: hypothetical protein KJN72_08580 [Woeseia sp.]|nr:hypothetical protein [Woeseia sp.]
MKQYSVWVFTVVPLLAALALAADLIPKHGLDQSWSGHARFHATWAAAKFLALGIVVALIAQNAFKKEERWAWWAMATYLFIGIGGIIPAMVWHGDGPPTRPLVMTGIMALLMLVALIVSAKNVFSSTST